MKKVLINYADSSFENQRRWNTRFAKLFGGFDKIIEYTPIDIDVEFYNKNKHILIQKRGGGYWLWKPYFIYKTLVSLAEGDFLFYADSGSVMIRSISYLIKALEASGQSIMPFDLSLIEKQWTKRDAFILLDCDSEYFRESNQRLASFILLKKTKQSIEFCKKYLELSQDDRLLTDILNTQGYNNFKEFIDHRHDQSIFSLLSKKMKLKAFRDPSHTLVFYNPYIYYLQKPVPKREYPIILIQNRSKNIFLYILKFVFYQLPKGRLRTFYRRYIKANTPKYIQHNSTDSF